MSSASMFVKTPATVGAVRGCGYTRAGGAPNEGYMLTPAKRCSGPCGRTLPLTEFYVCREKKDGRASWCKSCEKSRVLAYTQEHAEENRQRSARWKENNPGCRRSYYEEHRPEILENVRQWRQDNAEHVKARERRHYRENQRARREAARQYARDLRAQVFAHYGTVCACCGSAEYLTVDHVHGDGREHRAQLPKSPLAILRWLIKNEFPEGFQTLCRSCNASKGRGVCCRIDHSLEEVA